MPERPEFFIKRSKAPQRIALVGNPSVGKSAMFSQITGTHVIISNIPQTTVLVQTGLSEIDGNKILVYDLPGVYSVSAVTEDEEATKEFLLKSRPDSIIDVVDATRLERNLYLTLQLVELGLPIVMSLNQVDLLKQLNLEIDVPALENELGVKIVPTIATQGEGIHETLKAASARTIDTALYRKVDYDDHIENAINEIIPLLPDTEVPQRAFAVRLLEEDRYFEGRIDDHILQFVKTLRQRISADHNEDVKITIARGRHSTADLIASAVVVKKAHKSTLAERFGEIATRPRTGFPLLFVLVGGMLALIFYIGGYLSQGLTAIFEKVLFPPIYSVIDTYISNIFVSTALKYTFIGLEAVIIIAVPYILIFFLFLAILEDVGYLPRVAFLLDQQMHMLGLHGRSIIPLLFGYGCSVPAIMATRMLPTKKEKIITSILITLIPCSARSAIILGVVATFAGIQYAVAIYVISISVVIASGWALKFLVPGRTAGLVIEIPRIREPMPMPILTKTWLRMREFLYLAVPLLIAGSIVFGLLAVTGTFGLIEESLAPLTVGLLGLPAFAIIGLIYGLLRKEMAVEMLAVASGTLALNTVMTPVQLFVFGLVVTLYIPCLATFGILVRELNWRWAVFTVVFTFILAVAVGAVANALLT